MNSTDEVLDDVLMLARAEALPDAAPDATEETPGQLLARRVLELHAMLLGGALAPRVWRECDAHEVVMRLRWLAERVWQRIAEATTGGPCTIIVRPWPEGGLRSESLAPVTSLRVQRSVQRYAVLCEAMPRAVLGMNVPDALRVAVCYGDHTARAMGLASAADSSALRARLTELELLPEPDEAFDPRTSVCEPVCMPPGISEEQARSVLLNGLTADELATIKRLAGER